MYWTEFKASWEKLIAGALGLGFGLSISFYTLSLFGPALIAEFGWSRSEFALVGSLPLLTAAFVPVAGRLVDRFGPRLAAIVGFIAVPLSFAGFATMSGELWNFFAIYIVMNIFGMFTTSFVFCRVIVENFDKARGLALSLVMTTPPAASAIAAPILGYLIESHGWRTGYWALAAASASGGVIAIWLMGHRKPGAKPKERPALSKLGLKKLMALMRHPTLLLILGGMLLVNLPASIASSQLKLVLEELGIDSATGTWLVSLYAIGVIVGRFASGLALDRMPAHIVALASLGLPAIGYLMMASEVNALAAVALSVGLIGLAQGAEADVGAYLISRRFQIENFSLLLAVMTLAVLGGTAVGSLILSAALELAGDYSLFLTISAASTLVGAAMFGMTSTRWAKGRDMTEAKEIGETQ